MPLNYDEYEASFGENETGEFYAIEHAGKDVLVIPTLQVEGNVLRCEYRLLEPSLTLDDVKGLVYVSLLGRFFAKSYVGKVRFVRFVDLLTHHESQTIYLG